MHANGFAISAKEKKTPQAFAAEAERAALPADFALVDLIDCVHVHSHVRRNYRL